MYIEKQFSFAVTIGISDLGYEFLKNKSAS